jgi:serine phosphatase RsbU (regulator of sigma subunit)
MSETMVNAPIDLSENPLGTFVVSVACGERSGASLPVSDPAGFNILIVEDSDSQAYRLRLCLQAKGWRVWKAATGAEARAMLFPDAAGVAPRLSDAEALPAAFDLVVLDYWLPDTTGDILCREIRSAPATCRVPILLMTAHEGKATEMNALGNGADDYVSKTVPVPVLLLRLEALLRKSRAHADLSRRYERERRVARALQEALLSKPPADAFPGLAIGTAYEPAWDEALVGGDFYDLRSLTPTTAALIIGDVAGKGLSAATLTAEVKYALRAFLHEDPDPGHALERLNDYLVESGARNPWADHAYIAACVVTCDAANGAVMVSGAGAEPPLLLRRDRETGEVQTEVVDTGDGMLLGVTRGETYGTTTFTLKPGDVLLLFTDGITEARQRPGGIPLGYPAACQIAGQAFATCCTPEARSDALGEMVSRIVAEIKAAAGCRLSDDVCLLAVQRRS